MHLENRDIFSKDFDMAITIAFKPGVTDNPGKAALDGFKTIFPKAGDNARISTYITYVFNGVPDTVQVDWLAKQLHNALIERAIFAVKGEKIPVIEYAPIAPSEYLPPSTIDLQ